MSDYRNALAAQLTENARAQVQYANAVWRELTDGENQVGRSDVMRAEVNAAANLARVNLDLARDLRDAESAVEFRVTT